MTMTIKATVRDILMIANAMPDGHNTVVMPEILRSVIEQECILHVATGAALSNAATMLDKYRGKFGWISFDSFTEPDEEQAKFVEYLKETRDDMHERFRTNAFRAAKRLIDLGVTTKFEDQSPS